MRRCIPLALALGWACFGSAAAAQEPASLQVVEVQPGTLVLYRGRADGSMEGLVVDRDRLVDVLRSRVLEQRGLGEVARVAPAGQRVDAYSWTSDEVETGVRSREYDGFQAAYAFEHTFARPFEKVRAALQLAPLEGDEGAGLLYGLAAAVALAVVLGLWALYRMVAVQVRFAERRSNFVSAVSHELKTPLTAVRMYGEMLRDGMVTDDAQRSEYYRTITAETERLTRLINNVLEHSQLERDARQLSLVVGDMAQLVRESIDVLRPHAEREGFELVLEVESGMPAARFDRDALMQVVFNLVDNALKYGRGRERRVVVRCAKTPEGKVAISVSDCGPGVSTDQLPQIFEPFYRGESELTRTQKGTGIGLSLVRSLVHRMGGQVDGRNLAGGFVIRVVLPGGGEAPHR